MIFDFIQESKKSKLSDVMFGIINTNKYPLDTEKHVRSAIRLFGHAEESKKKDLAKRIKIAADKYGVEIKPTTQVYRYLNESYITESASRDLDAVIEFNKKLNNMEYIIVTKNKKIITKIKAKDFDNYETLNPTEFIKYNGGICWDYVMYEAYAFSKYFRNIKYKTFFVCNYNKKSNPTHTFLLFYLNNKCYWFESSWKSHIGIYKFNSESCALSYITKVLYDDLSKDQLPVYEVFVREYNALDNNLINISGYEYMNYMDKLDDYKFNKTSICEPEYIYDAKKFFYHESYINENKKYEDIYEAIINGLIKYDQNPKVGKKDEKLFKNTGKSSDTDFGNKLCVCNLKGDYYKICQKLNKELKPLGARLSPDNYGTAFVHLNEQTQTERFYEVLKKKLEEDNNDEYINESFVRVDIDRSELTEEMLIDAANECAHYTKWCKMDDSSFCCVYELDSVSVNLNDATFCFARFNGDEESLNRVLKCCNENNSSSYGKFEVFAKENEHGVWLCGRMTELYTYKEVNESYINETSMRSKFNDSFEKKGNIKLSSFNKVTIDKQFVDKYKDKFKLLKHVDLNDDKRIAFLDKDNNLVGYIATNKEKDGLIWITALEISNQYKGYGLGKQLLDYGVKHLDAQALGVAHDNEVAIQMYKKYGFKISKESIDEVKRKKNLNYRMYIGGVVNESLEVDLTTNPFEKDIKLYHGDSYQDQQSVIKPEAINAGTKLSTPRTSSFWTKSFKYAECFAIMRLIGKYLGYKEVCFDGDMYHMYVKPSNYKQIEKSIKSCHIFVYEKTMDKKMISGGHVFYGEEFTIDVPVKPDKVYRLEFNDFKDIFYDAVICYPDDSDTTINNICNKSFEQMIKNGYKFDNIIKILLYHNPKEQLRIVKKYKKLQKASSVLESNKSDQLEVPDSYNNKPSVVELLDNTDPKRIFLSSDWHFYSLKYKKEKNAVNTRDIVSWCKNNIKDEDVFMYLGDMCFRWASDEDNKKVQEIFKSLPGIKILILGNHDIVAGEEFYLNCGFDYVLTELIWHDYIFTHKPINISNMNYIVDFHGHQHRWSEYNTTDGSKNVNVYPYYYDNKPVTLDYLLNNYEELIKKHGNKRSNWVGMGESSYIFGDTELDLDNINWWYVCLNNKPSCIDEELYYKTLEDAIKAYIKPEYFEKSDKITAYVYTCNGDRIDYDDNALKLIPMGKIWVDKYYNYDWTHNYPLDVINGKIIPVTNNEYFIKESSCMIEDLLNNINEYSAASYNPIIPTAKPHLVQLSMDNSVFSGTKFAFSQDIVSNKYMIVNEDCKLEIVDASALADIKCKIYEFVGNKYNINKIEESYKNDCTVDQAFLYTALSNKNLVTKDQIDFDDDFVPVDIELIKEKRESEKATIKEQWKCINGEQPITFPVLESAIIKNPIKGELTRYNDNIHLMESVDGYYLMNDLNNKRTKCVSSLDYITTAMIKSIY